jgi:Uma2 family endonuclease
VIAVKKNFDELYEEIIKLPEGQNGEILDGELFVQPRPAPLHAAAGSVLGGILFPFFRGPGGPGGWVILAEPELHLGRGPDVLIPDIAAWRRERMPEIPERGVFKLAPDWICEVLSPSTANKDRKRKMRIYAREKVQYAWLIDPKVQTLEAFRPEGERWLLLDTYGGDDKVHIEPFDAIELDLALLWAR